MSSHENRQPRRALAMLVIHACARISRAAHAWGFGQPVWIGQDGKVSTYEELDDRHLRNILRVLRREGETHTEQFASLEAEANRRGFR